MNCKNCGKEFERTNGRQLYCTKKCATNFTYKEMMKKQEADDRIYVACAICQMNPILILEPKSQKYLCYDCVVNKI